MSDEDTDINENLESAKDQRKKRPRRRRRDKREKNDIESSNTDINENDAVEKIGEDDDKISEKKKLKTDTEDKRVKRRKNKDNSRKSKTKDTESNGKNKKRASLIHANTLGADSLVAGPVEDFNFTVDANDLQEGGTDGTAFSLLDTMNFLHYNHGGTSIDESNLFDVDNGGSSHAYYMENFATGKFLRVNKKALNKAKFAKESSSDDAIGSSVKGNLSDLDKISNLTHRFHQSIGSVMLFFQGVLSGFVTFHLYWSIEAGTDDTFLSQYGPISGSVRRSIYIMSTLALVASGSRWLSTKKVRKPGINKATEAFVTMALFFLAFFTSLLMNPSDNRIFHASSGYIGNSTWTQNLLIEQNFAPQFTGWKVGNIFRFSFIITGWLLVCRYVHQAIQKSVQNDEVIHNIKNDLSEFYLGMSRLGGLNRNELPLEDLQQLRDWQKSILKETEIAIEKRLTRGAVVGALKSNTSVPTSTTSNA